MSELVDSPPEHLLRADDGAANPVLSGRELDALRRSGHEQQLHDGEVLYRPGLPLDTFYVVLDGEIRIQDGDRVLSELRRGNFLGEYGLLTGGLSYMTNIAHGKTTLLCVPVDSLLDIVSTEAVLSETILRALLMRRAILIGRGLGVRVLGPASWRTTRRLVEFLARNRIPHGLVELEADDQGASPVAQLTVAPQDMPLVIAGERVLRNPTLAQLATGLGIAAPIKPTARLDLLIVGAGPGGLAAAVYGASEGLETAVLDAISAGGQASTSSRIENYLGFPAGIAGGELAARATVQATKFGAHLISPVEALALSTDDENRLLVTLSDGDQLDASAVVIATGARYRGLQLPRVEELTGAGVYYAATLFEAETCTQGAVAIVGGGNSAGQAALFLADHATAVHLVVRRDGLTETMSDYLVSRIVVHDRITIHASSELAQLHGSERLEAITIRNNRDGSSAKREVCGLFLFTGAERHTGWLRGAVELDDVGFVLTGSDLEPEATVPLQTSVAGVFAVGDARSGSTKRVATAVGEGAMAIRLVHEHLRRQAAP